MDGSGDIDVLVVDDHRVFADALAEALRRHDGVRRVLVAHDRATALRASDPAPPDVALVDYRLGAESGIDTIRALQDAHPGCAVVLLSGVLNDTSLREAFEHGCRGVIEKDEPLEFVMQAVERAAAGETVLSQSLVGRVIPLLRRGGTELDPLSTRELQVLRLIANGASNAAIAEQLYLSVHTVRNHVANVLRKLGAHSKLEAVAVARERGVLA